ncbi:hypothetical protein BD414DRAFT_535666 [Trametes punicea]|nr:hypothetical protein BD414DRAFT_535666 [Trametes punicea]
MRLAYVSTTSTVPEYDREADGDSARSRHTDHYPAAFTDFHGVGAPCLYKMGSAWPIRDGQEARPSAHEMRPVHDHPIACPPGSTSLKRQRHTSSLKPPVIFGPGMANAEEAKPFCPIYIKDIILGGLRFGNVHVAIREWAEPRREARAPRTPVDSVPDFATPLSIRSRSPSPRTEGDTISASRKIAVFILTAAHVARSPSAGMLGKKYDQRREEMINLDSQAYDDPPAAILFRVCALDGTIELRQNMIKRQSQPQQEGRGDPEHLAAPLHDTEHDVDRQKGYGSVGSASF